MTLTICILLVAGFMYIIHLLTNIAMKFEGVVMKENLRKIEAKKTKYEKPKPQKPHSRYGTCHICGHSNFMPAGTCGVCMNCGSPTGGCS